MSAMLFAEIMLGNSGMLVGRTSFSNIASSSFFTNSKLFVHVGILKISCPLAVKGFKFQNLG